MEKAKKRTRDIQFYSEKNKTMILVHSTEARQYAKYLEDNNWVKKYKSCVELDLSQFSHIPRVDIRTEYFSIQWVSDFLIYCVDGRKYVREIVKADQLTRRATIEKLELSHRYWSALDITDWKIVIGSRLP